MRNADVRGVLTADEKGWLLRPERVIEPGQKNRTSVLEPIRIGRECQARTRRYLFSVGAYRAIRASLPKSRGRHRLDICARFTAPRRGGWRRSS
jgi:hypothetical protein